MLIGQVLSTNASQQQVVNNAKKISNQSNSHIVNDNNLDIDDLRKAVDIINQKLSELLKATLK